MSNQPTVFLVDDDENARNSMKFLGESVGLNVVTFPSAMDFMESYDPSQLGCLVLDVRMPQMSGTELQQKLVDAGIQIPTIFVSGHADVPTAARAFRSGAFDFLEKPVNNQELLDRIQQALQRDAQWREQNERAPEIRARLKKLTPRERDVLDHLVEGKSIKQIASFYNISIQTAAKHRSRVLEKMQVENDVELVNLLHSTQQ